MFLSCTGTSKPAPAFMIRTGNCFVLKVAGHTHRSAPFYCGVTSATICQSGAYNVITRTRTRNKWCRQTLPTSCHVLFISIMPSLLVPPLPSLSPPCHMPRWREVSSARLSVRLTRQGARCASCAVSVLFTADSGLQRETRGSDADGGRSFRI